MSNQPAVAADHPPPTWHLLRWRSRMPAYREQLPDGVTLTLLRLPGGSFWMGAPEGEEGSQDPERPVHLVTLGEFLLGQTPVTQAQWRVVAQWQPGPGEAPWELELNPDPAFFKGGNRPVEQVSWNEAEEFCRRLRLRTGKNYRLPSEAQWEYACRAGTGTPFYFGETLTAQVANFGPEEAEEDRHGELNQTTDVASFPANAWGLHDMHGNVGEWCADVWHNSYERAPEDGSAWLINPQTVERQYDSQIQNGTAQVIRGGSSRRELNLCRSAARAHGFPEDRSLQLGFRVCCLPSSPEVFTEMEPPTRGKKVYLSYAWQDSTPDGQRYAGLVDILSNAMAAIGITVERDRKQLFPGGRIRSFTRNLGKGDVILVVLSDRYLKSESCMFELYSIWWRARQDPGLSHRGVMTLALPDATLRSTRDKLAVAEYWLGQQHDLEAQLKQGGLDAMGASISIQLKTIQQFSPHTADMLEFLTDQRQVLDFDRQAQEGFREVLDQILAAPVAAGG
jgi:formylglycine-generating enzyme required for sulfatase activity